MKKFISAARNKKASRIVAVIVIVFGFLSLLFAASFNFEQINALDPKSAYKIGANGDGTVLTDVWDSSSKQFKANYLKELFSKSIGKTGATIADVKTYIDTKGVTEFGSKVLKASTIRTNAGNANFGIVVKMNGYDWMVTSFTLDKNGNVVATLYLAENNGTSQFNTTAEDNTSKTAPDSMYSTAPIRTTLKSKFAAFATGDFAQKYLIQPTNIAYQHTENNTVKKIKDQTATFPNDALDNVSGYNNSALNFYNKANYNAWGNDYIWLPSITETGCTGWESNGIWGLNANQLIPGSSACWLRSGSLNNSFIGGTLKADGLLQGMKVTDTHGLRPAVHLNLSAAAGNSDFAYQIGANGDGSVLTELWNSSSKKFERNYLTELLSKAIGKENATAADVKAYIETNGETEFGSKIVKSPALRANSGNENYGIVVRLNGFDWMVTSLTIDQSGNPVATLYLTDDQSAVVFNPTDTNTNTSAAPSHMYGTAPIRTNLISPTGAFAAFATGAFASTYLVKPDNIPYQHTQNNSVKKIAGATYALPNDALDSVSGYYSGFDYTSKMNYNAWGNDSIWLPSMTETGCKNFESVSVWGLNANQLAHAGQVCSWLRSGFYNSFSYVDILNSSGINGSANVKDSYGLRPAIHLNLAAAVDAPYLIGENGDGSVITDVWDQGLNKFKEPYLKELFYRVTGIADATVGDVKRYIAENGADEFGSKVVKAPQIGTNAGNPDYGIVMRVNGFDWIVTSLTLDQSGNPVATLYLKDNQGSAVFHTDDTSPNTGAAPSNMYGTSAIRTTLNRAAGAFGAFAAGSFAQNYLVKPNDVAYQRTQKNGFIGYVLPNDALDRVDGYQNGYDYTDKAGYNAWGNDYLWLPSMTETGRAGGEAKSVWGLNVNQMRKPGGGYSWLRSGTYDESGKAYRLTAEGATERVSVNTENGVRPAIHLNLAAAARSETVNNAYKIGEAGDGSVLTDVWDGTAGAFRQDYLNELIAKAIGKSNAGIGDVKDYINTHGVEEFGSKVVKAPQIRSNAGNANYGIVIRVNGFDWIVTSLTLDSGGNVAATLYLADDCGETIFNTNASNDQNSAAPSNMYSTSDLRKTLTDSSGAFRAFSSGTFAQRYLIQPNKIAYQRKQNNSDPGKQINGIQYALPNDALDSVTGYYAGYDYTAKAGYNAWGSDYVWIPSLTEAGCTGSENKSIWGLNANQLAHREQAYLFMRSGIYNSWIGVYEENASGGFDSGNVNFSHGVRPAVHLNLSAAIGEELSDPGDISTVYGGERQTLPGLPTAPGWYDAARYGDASKIVVTYPADGIVDAGEYWVKVEIAAAWLQEAQASGGKIKFKGTANTSDQTHMESDTVRWFKWTVTPKEITVNAPSYDADTGTVTGPTYANADEFVSVGRPTLAVRYVGTGATTYDKIDVPPTARGTYKAIAILINSAGDPTLYSGNYVIKNADQCFTEFTINRGRLQVPTVTENSKSYTGEGVTFTLAGYSDALSDRIEIICPQGLTLSGSGAARVLTAVEAGEYTVTARLKDPEQYCWDKAGQEVVADQTFTVTVRRKELTVTFGSTTGVFQLETGDRVTFSAAENSLARDEVVLTLSYYNKANPGALAAIANGTLDASTLAPGEYALVAILEDAKSTGNKNYYINGDNGRVEKSFTVSARSAAIDAVEWRWSQNNGAKTDVAGGAGTEGSPLTLTYNGSAYAFEVKTDGFGALGVKLDTSAAAIAAGYANGYKNAAVYRNATDGSVTVTVRLAPADGYAFNDENGHAKPNQFVEFTLYLKIGKAKYDLSEVRWSDAAPEFTGSTLSIGVEKLPDGLTVTANDYTGNTGIFANDYTATLLRFQNAKSDNYITPVKGDETTYAGSFEWQKAWKIAKKKLALEWTTKPATDKNGVDYGLPVLTGDPAQVEYTYQSADAAFRPTGALADVTGVFVDPGKVTYYLVTAVLKPDSAQNYELSAEGENPYRLTLGKDKNEAVVTLKSDSVDYAGTPREAQIEVESGGVLTPDDFTLTYYKKGDLGTPLAGAPVDAGEYVVKVAFREAQTSENWYVTGTELAFTVNKIAFDVSGLSWKYDDALPYETAFYYDGTEHELYLDGKDAVDGLTIAYAAGSERAGTFAKTYTITLEFTYNATNYEAPTFPSTFGWEIKKCVLDLSGVVWSYTEPFRYGWENGAAKVYEVGLLNLPAYLETVVKYRGTNRSDAVGSYNTSYYVEGFDAANYEAYEFPASLTADLNWRIEARRLGRPKAEAEFTYDGRAHDLLTLLDMNPADLGVYYSVAATKNGETVAGFDPLQVTDAGVYALSFALYKDRFGENVTWDNNSVSNKGGSVTVKPITLTLRSWNRENEPPTAVFDNAGDGDYIDYVIRDERGNVVDKMEMQGNTLYSVEAVVKAQYGENVILLLADGAAASATFTTEADDPLNPAEKLVKPTIADPEAEFTGAEIAFTIADLNEKYLELTADGDALTQTAAGVYRVTVKFKAGANARWADDNTKNPVTLRFEITKKKFVKPSGTLETDFDGGIRTFTPDGYDAVWMSIAGNAGTNADNYRATVTLRDPINTVWADDTTEPVALDWRILKRFLAKPTLTDPEIEFTGAEITVGMADFDGTHMTVEGNAGTNAGNYTATVKLKDQDNTAWVGGGTEDVTLSWTVAALTLEKPTLRAGDAPEFSGAAIAAGIAGFDAAHMTMDGNTGTNAGNYTATVKLKDKVNTAWAGGGTDDVAIAWTIAALKLEKPTLAAGEAPQYTGGTVTRALNGCDDFRMIVTGNSGINAGSYTATVSLKDKVNTEWVGGGTDDVTIAWSIATLKLEKPTAASAEAPEYTGAPITLGLAGADAARMTVAGNTATNAGNYTATVSLKDKSNTEWVGGGAEDVTIAWTIAKAKLEVSWDTSGAAPKLDLETLPEDAVEYVYFDDAGNAVAADALVAGKSYSVKAKLKDEYAKNYGFEIGDAIRKETEQKAFTPNPPGGGGDPIVSLPENFPLWQVIVCGAALVLGLLFLCKAISNGKKTKKLKKKTSQKLFGFAGLPFLGAAGADLFGLSGQLWMILAIAAAVFCAACFVAMAVTGRKRAAAAEGFERAKKEDSEEKAKAERLREEQEAKKERERREEEERLRREADMKVMFMMMNGGRAPSPEKEERTESGQPIFTYTATGQPMFNAAPQVNVEDVVTRVVAALMPAMQALPAAGGSSAGNEVLGNLIEKQMEMLERQSRLIETLKNERTGGERPCFDEYEEDEDERDEWPDDEEDDFYEAEDDGTEEAGADALPPLPPEARVRLPANFRVRLKATSEKNRDAYAAVKNRLKGFRGVSFRMSGRLEKVNYRGEPIALIGVARKSLKVWFALDPEQFERNRYRQRDESAKLKYARTPMLVRIGSDRALARAAELIDALAKKLALAPKRKNPEAGLQELAYTLKYNTLVRDKKQSLLRGAIHVHDADVLSGEAAERYLEVRERARFETENFTTVSLDVLDGNFYDGQKVTLEKLKAKGLVSEEYNGYRLTAGERLTKPLYVIADEFSSAAVKMIVLTGGRAVRLADPFAPKFS